MRGARGVLPGRPPATADCARTRPPGTRRCSASRQERTSGELDPLRRYRAEPGYPAKPCDNPPHTNLSIHNNGLQNSYTSVNQDSAFGLPAHFQRFNSLLSSQGPLITNGTLLAQLGPSALTALASTTYNI